MGWGEKKIIDAEQEEIKTPKKHKRGRRTEIFERDTKNVYRRAFSETQLLDCFNDVEIKNNHSYHCISAGDVDSLSYLKIILRKQKVINKMIFSTWCMAADDISQFEEWLEDGRIIKLDAYLGEIFPKSYPFEWKKINEIFDRFKCGRIAIFRNHSKVYAGHGDDFSFAIESSANINTNPRTEQTCITIDKGLADFYIDYYEKINSFEK